MRILVRPIDNGNPEDVKLFPFEYAYVCDDVLIVEVAGKSKFRFDLDLYEFMFFD